MNPFNLGSRYNFNTISTLLDTNIKNAEVMGVVGFDIVNSFQNIVAVAASVAPDLPSNVSKDPKTYTYICFKLSNGSKTFLALEWIDLNSVVLTSAVTIVATINQATLSDLTTVKNALLQMGYNDIKVTSQSSEAPTLIKIFITTSSVDEHVLSIGNSDTLVLNAYGIYSDNSVENITSQVSWFSSNNNFATVNSVGLVNPIGIGSADINATANGLNSIYNVNIIV